MTPDPNNPNNGGSGCGRPWTKMFEEGQHQSIHINSRGGEIEVEVVNERRGKRVGGAGRGDGAVEWGYLAHGVVVAFCVAFPFFLSKL